MSNTSLRLDHWPSVVGHLSSLLDVDASAREHGALLRRRGVRSAADLLQLALLYGPGGLSLRGVASFATEAGIADLCDVSLLERLRRSGNFLAVLAHLLADGRGEAAVGGALQLSLGSSQPGRMLLTSLPAERAAPDEVVRLYRMRWQVELAFKRLKSLGRFGDLSGSDRQAGDPKAGDPKAGARRSAKVSFSP